MAIDKNFIMGYGAGKASKTNQTIIEETDAWLEENISQETGYVLDRTLTLQNAAAPADMVGDLKSALKNQNEIVTSIERDNKFPFNADLFGVGEISNGTYYPTQRPYRCCTKIPFEFYQDISITAKSGYRFYPHLYINNAWAGQGWKTDTYIIPHGTKFGIVFAKVTESTSITANVEEFLNNYILQDEETEKNILLYVADNGIKSINHRGYNSIAPENTVPAFLLSRKKGFKYVESDVRFTSDNIPVMLHDATIDRTSNGTGNINELTYSQVSQYDFGSWKSSEYAGTKIPTLGEFLLLCKKLGLNAYLELKDGYSDYQNQLKIAYDETVKCGMAGKITWISTRKAYLAEISLLDEKARIGYVTNGVSSSIISDAIDLRNGKNEVFIDSNSSNVDATAIALCIESGIPLEMWRVDSTATIINMDAYITGVASNTLNAGIILYESSL